MSESFKPASGVETSSVKVESLKKRLIEKFPHLQRAAIVFATLAGSLFGAANTGAENIPTENGKTTIEAVSNDMTAEQALEKVSDKEFTEVVQKLSEQLESNLKKAPENSIYHTKNIHRAVNEGSTFEDEVGGTLAESGHDLKISNSGILKTYSKQSAENDKATLNNFTGTADTFYVVSAEHGTIEGAGTMIEKGESNTEEKAIAQALESYAMFMGETIDSSNNLNRSSEDTHMSENFGESIKTNAEHYIKQYKVIEHTVEEGEFGPVHKVSVEVQYGKFIPEAAK